MIYRILLAGDGGQGIQTMSDLICRTAFQKGLHVTNIPNYGLEQRGGASLSFIQISDSRISYPKFSKADLLAVLSIQGRDRSTQYRHDKTEIIDFRDTKADFESKKINLQNLNIYFLNILAIIFEKNKLFDKSELLKLVEEKFQKKASWEEIRNIFN